MLFTYTTYQIYKIFNIYDDFSIFISIFAAEKLLIL